MEDGTAALNATGYFKDVCWSLVNPQAQQMCLDVMVQGVEQTIHHTEQMQQTVTNFIDTQRFFESLELQPVCNGLPPIPLLPMSDVHPVPLMFDLPELPTLEIDSAMVGPTNNNGDHNNELAKSTTKKKNNLQASETKSKKSSTKDEQARESEEPQQQQSSSPIISVTAFGLLDPPGKPSQSKKKKNSSSSNSNNNTTGVDKRENPNQLSGSALVAIKSKRKKCLAALALSPPRASLDDENEPSTTELRIATTNTTSSVRNSEEQEDDDPDDQETNNNNHNSRNHNDESRGESLMHQINANSPSQLLLFLMQHDENYSSLYRESYAGLLSQFDMHLHQIEEEVLNCKNQCLEHLRNELRKTRNDKKLVFANAAHRYYKQMEALIEKHFKNWMLHIETQSGLTPMSPIHSVPLTQAFLTHINQLRSDVSNVQHDWWLKTVRPGLLYMAQIAAIFLRHIRCIEVISEFKRKKETSLLSEFKERKLKLFVYRTLILLDIDYTYQEFTNQTNEADASNNQKKLLRKIQNHLHLVKFNKTMTKELTGKLSVYVDL